ncbi:MAG: MBL fold metallo-hydrolase [Gammaproteobacteria bacterium]|nr:MBL fold metallo-hydrolase [Gammaproteobacteria bacterium]
MQLQFHGAAGGEVTGSCYQITVGTRQLLVDCGLIQGRPQDEARNRDPFPFDIKAIDAVILTHAHLDHAGRLPLLVRSGYQGPIYAHEATRDLCRIMLRDAAYINEREVEWENRKRERKGLKLIEPLYTLKDAEATMAQFRPLAYGRREELLPGVTLQLQDAGHILGASIVELWLREGDLQRKLLFSGDLGHHNAPVMRNPTPIEEADLVVMESTYGDRLHRGWKETWEELTGIIEDATAHSGNILIPSFAVGRTQDLLYGFARHFDEWGLKGWSIFLDSPLAIEATEVYRRHIQLFDAQTRDLFANDTPFSLPNLHLSRRAEESMAINRIRSGAIVIAGSGMCNGGRIKHHFKHNIWQRNCHVIIVGFQVQGTLGRALVDGARHIRLWGETVKVEAKIHTLGGFSAHADHDGLLNWYETIKGRPPVILTHGEENARHHLETSLHQRLHAQVFRPQRADIFDLRALGPLTGG